MGAKKLTALDAQRDDGLRQIAERGEWFQAAHLEQLATSGDDPHLIASERQRIAALTEAICERRRRDFLADLEGTAQRAVIR